MQRTARTLFWAMNVLQGIAQAACSEFMPSFYLNPRIIEINLLPIKLVSAYIYIRNFSAKQSVPNETRISFINEHGDAAPK